MKKFVNLLCVGTLTLTGAMSMAQSQGAVAQNQATLNNTLELAAKSIDNMLVRTMNVAVRISDNLELSANDYSAAQRLSDIKLINGLIMELSIFQGKLINDLKIDTRTEDFINARGAASGVILSLGDIGSSLGAARGNLDRLLKYEGKEGFDVRKIEETNQARRSAKTFIDRVVTKSVSSAWDSFVTYSETVFAKAEQDISRAKELAQQETDLSRARSRTGSLLEKMSGRYNNTSEGSQGAQVRVNEGRGIKEGVKSLKEATKTVY